MCPSSHIKNASLGIKIYSENEFTDTSCMSKKLAAPCLQLLDMMTIMMEVIMGFGVL